MDARLVCGALQHRSGSTVQPAARRGPTAGFRQAFQMVGEQQLAEWRQSDPVREMALSTQTGHCRLQEGNGAGDRRLGRDLDSSKEAIPARRNRRVCPDSDDPLNSSDS
jgi:hypothetical protein